MKKLFISQPMRGKSDETIQQERDEAIISAKALTSDDIEVLDTFFTNFDGNAVAFLGKSISALSEADVAYFAPGWREARGCVIENQVCKAYDIKVIET